MARIKEKMSLKKQMLLEGVALGIVFVISIVSGFDFLRSDIKSILGLIGWGAIGSIFLIGLKEKAKIDESAKIVLGKVDGICLNILMLYILVLSSLVSVFYYRSLDVSLNFLSKILCVSAFLILILRAILFIYYDRKGTL
ncbi:hypothetical protein [Clostridium sp. B9]|uniref:hypothetical protein n=1 Tax=Clostridium sp. B9 TaxID=3423224 RepID=UPI003D2F30B9